LAMGGGGEKRTANVSRGEKIHRNLSPTTEDGRFADRAPGEGDEQPIANLKGGTVLLLGRQGHLIPNEWGGKGGKGKGRGGINSWSPGNRLPQKLGERLVQQADDEGGEKAPAIHVFLPAIKKSSLFPAKKKKREGPTGRGEKYQKSHPAHLSWGKRKRSSTAPIGGEKP